MALVQPPDLDIRNVAQITAQAIARVSDGATVELIDNYVGALLELRAKIESGAIPAEPLCSELTNANYSSDHTALIEAFAWLVEQLAWRINLLPERDAIEFHRLFGIEQRAATKAQTTLRFTVAAPPAADVVIPAGTLVSAEDEAYIFETTEELIVLSGEASGDVAASRTVPGVTLLAPNKLTVLQEPIAFVTGVTNPSSVDSGSQAETLASALERARSYQRRGERLVSVRDIEEAVLYEVMGGVGIVKAFDLVAAGDWTHMRAGHTTLIVMSPAGTAISTAQKAAINALLDQAIGSQFIYVLDPVYTDFNIQATISITALASQTAVRSAVEKSLRDFYGPRRGNFGRWILRSEIVAIIEGTQGVARIVSEPEGPILQQPVGDISLAAYELPRLQNVTINVV